MKNLVKYFSILMLVSCTRSTVEKNVQNNELIITDDTKIMRGHYIWGHEVNTFTPCGSESSFWVEGNLSSLKDLEAKYKILTKTPYEKTFVTIIGKTRPKDANSDGFDSDYDGLISIESIKSMTNGSNADCK